MSNINHRWNFFKAGGAVQINLGSGADIENIAQLDAKLWSALSCPTVGLTLDSKTLAFVDYNNDGRIRRGEIIQACQWVCARVKNADALLRGDSQLLLLEINTDSADGGVLLESAKTVLANIGKASAEAISVDDFADESRIFAASPFNADGIITALSCGDDADLVSVFNDVLACSTPKKDRSGLDGVDAADIEAFFADAAAALAWNAKLDADGEILFMGEDTAAAFGAFEAVESQIEDWFARSQIIFYNPDAQEAMFERDNEKLVAAFADLDFEVLAKLPIVKLNSAGEMDFSSGVNPAWTAQCEAFKGLVLERILKKSTLTLPEWKGLMAKFAPHKAWSKSKPSSAVVGLGFERLTAVAVEANKNALLELVAKDVSRKDDVDNIASVEKLVRFNRDLFKLLKNFVSFQDFYSHGGSGIFQYGNLFIDRRMCAMCVRVENVDAHAKMAAMGQGYLVYCNCRRKDSPSIDIVAMITAGDCDNIIVGRNGIFYDYLGNEWDATITKVVDNPIGVYQAFSSPYKRVIKWIGETVSKKASDADKSVISKVESLETVDSKKDAKKFDVGTIAALGVAVGGITTAFGMVLEAVFGLGYWLPLGVVGIILAISLPSMFVAWLKLRMRNLAPLLDGNGWAVNNKASVSMSFGAYLTKTAKLPKGSKFCAVDRFPEKHVLRNVAILLLIAILAACAAFYFWRVSHPKTVCPAEAPVQQVSAATQQGSQVVPVSHP